MILIGRIAKQEGPFWSADIDAIGAYAQGNSRKDATAVLAQLVDVMVERPGFKTSVVEIGSVGANEYEVLVTATEPALLAALVLKYQREVHGLSLADVAKKLGSASRNAYASYERGEREPSLSKFSELLGVVAPEMMLTVGTRGAAVSKRKTKVAR